MVEHPNDRTVLAHGVMNHTDKGLSSQRDGFNLGVWLWLDAAANKLDMTEELQCISFPKGGAVDGAAFGHLWPSARCDLFPGGPIEQLVTGNTAFAWSRRILHRPALFLTNHMTIDHFEALHQRIDPHGTSLVLS